MKKRSVWGRCLAVLMTAVVLVLSGIQAGAQQSTATRTLVMDTRSYQMAPGNLYDIKVSVSGANVSSSDVVVYSSRDSVAKVSRIAGTDKYRITALKEGTTYITSEVYGVHASVCITVKKGVQKHGEANRSVTVIGTASSQSEMRAVWIPYMSLDMSGQADRSEAAFRKKFDTLVAQAKNSGMNTLIVHVRPFGDSMYPSAYYPWSHLLTGTQGTSPGYDPLAYMIQATHQAGLKFHAWVNPLRVSLKGLPKTFSSDNPAVIWKNDASKQNWTMEWNGEWYYNPGISEVRDRIVSGVREIVQNYDVDGVQFDDYFYPTTASTIDSVSYLDSGTSLSVADWRRQNINTLVSQVYAAVKQTKSTVLFGISPQANLQNNRNMGADVATWGSQAGYVDYLCPQLYVNSSNAVMPFDATAVTWRKMVTNPNVKLYFGLALYKADSNVDGGTWMTPGSVMAYQIQKSRSLGSNGFMLYSAAFLENSQTSSEMAQVKKLLHL